MKRSIPIILILFMLAGAVYLLRNTTCPFYQAAVKVEKAQAKMDVGASEEKILRLLKKRKDELAMIEAKRLLASDPDNLTALWARAEVLRRDYDYTESEELLGQILSKHPAHAPSLISLSYIRYHDGSFKEALLILERVLKLADLKREDRAMAYMLMGTINAKKSSAGNLLDKILYGTRIKGYFAKARSIAPELPEVHLGLGAFYLLAPGIAGGSLDKAIEELKIAVELTPDFATPYARLAQAYKRKGDLEKFDYYISRVKELNPENETLKEILAE
ncbi:tetratricopeptide repeat protein [Candidatus Omnitrophota bacterium]